MPTGHYQRKPRGPYAGKRNPAERFWERADKNGPIPNSISFPDLKTPCWMWKGSVAFGGRPETDGYGRFWVDGRHVGAHIYSYELEYGPVPDGLELDHKCRNTLCVRPDHEEAVTPTVNKQRSTSAAVTKARHAAKTHCKKGHAWTPENKVLKPDGRHRCLTCVRERNKLFMRTKVAQKRAAANG